MSGNLRPQTLGGTCLIESRASSQVKLTSIQRLERRPGNWQTSEKSALNGRQASCVTSNQFGTFSSSTAQRKAENELSSQFVSPGNYALCEVKPPKVQKRNDVNLTERSSSSSNSNLFKTMPFRHGNFWLKACTCHSRWIWKWCPKLHPITFFFFWWRSCVSKDRNSLHLHVLRALERHLVHANATELATWQFA